MRTQTHIANNGIIGIEVNDMCVFLPGKNDPSKITAANIAANNGVIPVIDTDLVPQQFSPIAFRHRTTPLQSIAESSLK